MLVRIVRMTFKPEEVNTFLELFETVKLKIRSFEGCEHLELLRDYDNASIYHTYSVWNDGDHLEKYRKSELFQDTWAKTKVLFADKPKAFSLLKETPFEFGVLQ